MAPQVQLSEECLEQKERLKRPSGAESLKLEEPLRKEHSKPKELLAVSRGESQNQYTAWRASCIRSSMEVDHVKSEI